MEAVYILAHFDDEYAAIPLLLHDKKSGRQPWLLYVADYASPDTARRRLAETRALIRHLSLDPSRVVHVGAGSGVLDGAVHQRLDIAYAALLEATSRLGAISRFTVAAWEGGHQDHDACAALALALASQSSLPTEIEQFGLYNARSLPAPLFRAAWPIPENGPCFKAPLSMGAWLNYVASVRFFPSQAKTWMGLWPSMMLSFLVRGGYHRQTLKPGRIAERPHAGPLLYERMFKVRYESVRLAIDVFWIKTFGTPLETRRTPGAG